VSDWSHQLSTPVRERLPLGKKVLAVLHVGHGVGFESIFVIARWQINTKPMNAAENLRWQLNQPRESPVLRTKKERIKDAPIRLCHQEEFVRPDRPPKLSVSHEARFEVEERLGGPQLKREGVIVLADCNWLNVSVPVLLGTQNQSPSCRWIGNTQSPLQECASFAEPLRFDRCLCFSSRLFFPAPPA
jgi:hypothetical protein